jgi:hypothetical protein
MMYPYRFETPLPDAEIRYRQAGIRDEFNTIFHPCTG